MKNKKVYYYTFKEVYEELVGGNFVPYASQDLYSFCEDYLDGGIPSFLPFSLTDTNVETLWQNVCATYYREIVIKITKELYEDDPTSTEIGDAFIIWLNYFLTQVAKDKDYYLTMLELYNTHKANLMADITATSSNRVYFNDTPQNINNNDQYEGDDYLTHFTKTAGETTSPLMSKMMRLKEIQENYRNLMGDWVRRMERLFIEGANL